ncbi:hypothetical protein CWATWH0401_3098 [Crocosphaera watsonii WH 0401]|uniref:Uncharacterized protein n=1 Tax=Crocosphaera watsonii WH 0401 TaxID=555881 RepID=T2JH38_CROWT|nr:hypothetical protein CWATWH0401_3098 [Crocosphaera watsonii WH 0401]
MIHENFEIPPSNSPLTPNPVVNDGVWGLGGIRIHLILTTDN